MGFEVRSHTLHLMCVTVNYWCIKEPCICVCVLHRRLQGPGVRPACGNIRRAGRRCEGAGQHARGQFRCPRQVTVPRPFLYSMVLQVMTSAL